MPRTPYTERCPERRARDGSCYGRACLAEDIRNSSCVQMYVRQHHTYYQRNDMTFLAVMKPDGFIQQLYPPSKKKRSLFFVELAKALGVYDEEKQQIRIAAETPSYINEK